MQVFFGNSDVSRVRAVVIDAGDLLVRADVRLTDLALIAVATAADRSFDDAVADRELRDLVADLDDAASVLMADDRRQFHPLERRLERVDAGVAPAESGVLDLD